MIKTNKRVLSSCFKAREKESSELGRKQKQKACEEISKSTMMQNDKEELFTNRHRNWPLEIRVTMRNELRFLGIGRAMDSKSMK